MEKIRIAILGFGQRGYIYANIIKSHPDEMELAAVCEINPSRNHSSCKCSTSRKKTITPITRKCSRKGRLPTSS